MRKHWKRNGTLLVITAVVVVVVTTLFFTQKEGVLAAPQTLIASYPTYAEVRNALREVLVEDNGGFGFNMWATIVDRNGVVKLVTASGDRTGDQWPGSRLISAQKANTANAFSLPGFALSTANLFTATQPGGSLFGLQVSNPVNTSVAYGGDANDYGTENDPMIGGKIGGVNVFGGGLALYNANGTLIGGIGVSGDSSCADHNIAWRLRHRLNLDNVPAGVGSAPDNAAPNGNDNIVYDIVDGVSASGWGHPECSDSATQIAGNAHFFSPTGPER